MKKNCLTKLAVIQTNVPMCPECNGMLKLNKIMQSYLCHACDIRYRIVDYGQTEREFICEYTKTIK